MQVATKVVCMTDGKSDCRTDCVVGKTSGFWQFEEKVLGNMNILSCQKIFVHFLLNNCLLDSQCVWWRVCMCVHLMFHSQCQRANVDIFVTRSVCD